MAVLGTCTPSFAPLLSRAALLVVLVLAGIGGPVKAQAASTGNSESSSLVQSWSLQALQQIGDQTPNVVDLARAWQLVQENDATFQAAVSAREAAETQRAQGRSALLPKVRAGYSRSQIKGTRTQPNIFGRRVQSELSYDSQNAYIQLEQPLLDYSRFAQYKYSVSLADLGHFEFEVARTEAARRLAETYFGVLVAHERLRLLQALADSLKALAEAQEALYGQNEATRIDAQQTRARLDIAQADAIQAEDELAVARRELESLLGMRPVALASISEALKLQRPLQTLSDYLQSARVSNPEIRTARQNVEVAGADVQRATSQFLPSAYLVGNWVKADSEDLSVLSQRTDTFSIGINVSIPIFTGGYSTANHARARLERNVSQQELHGVLEKVDADVMRAYTGLVTGADRVEALRQSERSAQLNVEATTKGYEYGTVSNLDVLKAEDALFQARNELFVAKGDFLLSQVELALATGAAPELIFQIVSDAALTSALELDGK